MRSISRFAVTYVVIIALAQDLSVNYFPGTLSTEKNGMKIGSDDATLDMYGWTTAATKFDSLYRDDIAAKVMPTGAPLVVNDWLSASHIDYYLVPATSQQCFGVGTPADLHQYYWMNSYKKQLLPGANAYYVMSSNLFSWDKFNKIVSCFRDYNYALIFPEYRSGAICREFYFIRLYGYQPGKRVKNVLTDTASAIPGVALADTTAILHQK